MLLEKADLDGVDTLAGGHPVDFGCSKPLLALRSQVMGDRIMSHLETISHHQLHCTPSAKEYKIGKRFGSANSFKHFTVRFKSVG